MLPRFAQSLLTLLCFAQSLWRSLTLLCRFGAPSLCSVAWALPGFAQSLWHSLTLLCRFGAPLLRSVAFDAPSLRSVAFHSMVSSNWKMSWYPHANKLLQKWVIFNEAINLHSRGPTEQHLYVLEPHHGYLHKVKNVSWCPLIKESHHLAIILENVLVPPC